MHKVPKANPRQASTYPKGPKGPKPHFKRDRSTKAQGVISSVRAPFSQDLGVTSAACDKLHLLRGVHEQGS